MILFYASHLIYLKRSNCGISQVWKIPKAHNSHKFYWVAFSFPRSRVNDNLGLWIFKNKYKGVGGRCTSTYDCGRRFQGISSFFDEATPKTHTSIVVSWWNITPTWLFPHYTGDKTNMYECRLPLKTIMIDINFSCCCWLRIMEIGKISIYLMLT